MICGKTVRVEQEDKISHQQIPTRAQLFVQRGNRRSRHLSPNHEHFVIHFWRPLAQGFTWTEASWSSAFEIGGVRAVRIYRDHG
jgi:hypothetical protein